MSNKICTFCKKEKAIDEFNKNKIKKDGHNNFCRECGKEKSKKYYNSNLNHHRKITNARSLKRKQENREFILKLLSTSKCSDCDITDIRVLEFDHLPEFKKKNDVSYLVSNGASINTIKEEISKCEIVCANCHKIRTISRSKNHYRRISAVLS